MVSGRAALAVVFASLPLVGKVSLGSWRFDDALVWQAREYWGQIHLAEPSGADSAPEGFH